MTSSNDYSVMIVREHSRSIYPFNDSEQAINFYNKERAYLLTEENKTNYDRNIEVSLHCLDKVYLED